MAEQYQGSQNEERKEKMERHLFQAYTVDGTHCSWATSNPTLIHGLKQTSKYEIASWMGYEKPKKWQLQHSVWKIFCNLDMSIP